MVTRCAEAVLINCFYPPSSDSACTTFSEVSGAAGPAEASVAIPNPTNAVIANDEIPSAAF